MLSVKGIYDGHNLKLLEKVEVTSPQDVVVVFLNDIEKPKTEAEVDGKHIQEYISQSKSFDFLKDEREDVYSDADLKVKY